MTYFKLSIKTSCLCFLLLAICYSCFSDQVQDSSKKEDILDSIALIELNHLIYTIANEHDQFYSFIGVRSLSMCHLAIHDILNTTAPRFERYAYKGKTEKVDPLLSSVEATKIILKDIYPDRVDTIEQVCLKILNSYSISSEKDKSLQLGQLVAQTYIEKREGDGHEKQGDYTPMTKPGDYQYTPGFDNWVLYPDFDYARPFTMDSVTQFRVAIPPALDSEVYEKAFNEVKEFGRKNSTVRSEDQTNYAHWWAEFGEHSWNRIGRIVAQEKALTSHQIARMFALINMNLYDLYLASLESKYHYDTWRPYTAIRTSDSSLNPNTEADPNWEPEMLTPPWPEYPSAHAAVGAGGAKIISHVLGTSELAFSMESVTALPTAKERTFTNLDTAANECANSRIMNGYHFRFATDEGVKQGEILAEHILSNYLIPIGEKE